MNFVLYNTKTNNVQEITIGNLEEIHDLIEVYFNIPKHNQIIMLNDTVLNMNKDANENGLTNGDVLVINENDNANNTNSNNVSDTDNVNNADNTDPYNQHANILDEHMDNMLLQSQIAYTPMYIKGQYGDMAFKILIDSGAQPSVMSKYMAEILKIDHLINTKISGVAKGIGTSKLLGCIFGCNIKINDNIFVPVNLKILENDVDKYLVILGLDFLYSHKCVLDFENRSLKIHDNCVQFMNEHEINTYVNPFNIQKEKLQKQFDEMINSIPNDQQHNVTILLKKIINNIIKNPNNEKYKLINMQSAYFKENIYKYQKCTEFMKKIGFIQTTDEKFKFCNDMDMLNYANEMLNS